MAFPAGACDTSRMSHAGKLPIPAATVDGERARRAIASPLDHSPRSLAQRRRLNAAFGSAGNVAQLRLSREDEEALLANWTQWRTNLESAAVPIILPPAPVPSAHRFRNAALIGAAAAFLILLLLSATQAALRKGLESSLAKFTARTTSDVAAQRTMSAGCLSIIAFQILRAPS